MIACRELITEPVFACDGVLYLRVADARAVTLKYIDASPVRSLGGSWKANFVYTGLQSVLLLGLEQQGAQATWILAPDGRRLGDRLSDLEEKLRTELAVALIARGADAPRGLIGDGLQFVETRLLDGLLDLASVERARQAAKTAPTTSGCGLAVLGAPHRLRLHAQLGSLECPLLLHEGWDQRDGVFVALAPTSVARAGRVPDCPRALLTLCVAPLGSPAQTPIGIELRVNGKIVRSIGLQPQWQEDGATFSFWLAADLVCGKPLEIEFQHELGFRLQRLRLELAAIDDRAALDPAGLFAQFENIGDNCEFGLVQRHFKAEPVGLLRFAGLRDPTRLIRLLDDDFGSLGSAGSLSVMITAGEYWIIDKAYGLAAHTFRYQHECSAAEVIGENEIKLTYLRRKFREDLEDGNKILVYKRVVTEDLNEILALHAALNQYGTVNKLLWVTEAHDDHQPGDVHWVGDHLLKGYVGKISLKNANHFDAAIWLQLCRNAYAAFEAWRKD